MAAAHTPSDKRAWRAALLARRTELPPATRAAAEAVLLARLVSLPAWQQAPVICGYAATQGELDLTPVWQAAVAAGKTYALPVTVSGAREGRMVFRALHTFSPDALTPGRYGIAEPPATRDFPLLPASSLHDALLLVPGLGFDREGYRLGYGGGYYDRFLDGLAAAHVPVMTVGLCFSACRVDRLPREAHDRAVDIVIDER